MILSLIAAIMVTDFLFDGFRFALAAEQRRRDRARSALCRSSALQSHAGIAGLDCAMLRCRLPVVLDADGHGASHSSCCCRLGEHFHIVTALPALFFRRRRGVEPRADGRPRQADGSRRRRRHQGRRPHRRAISPGRMRSTHSPARNAAAARTPARRSSPASRLRSNGCSTTLKTHLLAQRDASVARRDEQAACHWSAAVIGEETLWACTTCGYCEAACPIELEHLRRFFRLRQHQVMMKGAVSARTEGSVRRIRSRRAIRGDCRPRRAATGRAGSTCRWSRPPPTSPGSTACSTWARRSRSIRAGRRSRARSSRSCGPPVCASASSAPPRRRPASACDAPATKCCFSRSRGSLVATLNALGVTRIVTCDPHAFNTLKNEYPEFGGHYEVTPSYPTHRGS